MNVEQNKEHTLKTKLLIKDREDTLDCDFSENAPMAKDAGVCESRLLD